MTEQLSLHRLLEQHKWKEALNAIEEKRVDLTEKSDGLCFSTLESALNFNAPYFLVLTIITVDPEQVKERNILSRNLPIHTACRLLDDSVNPKKLVIRNNSERHRIIQLLMNLHKEALWELSDEESYPIHTLMEYRPPASLVVEMLDCYEQVSDKNILTTKDIEEQTPLHIALQEHVPTDTIIALLRNDKGKQAMNIQGPKNYLPLHIAVFSGCTKLVLEKLLQKGATKYILDATNDNNMSALALAFGADSEHRWMSGFTWSESTGSRLPDGSLMNGVILGPPSDLLTQRELVQTMMDALRISYRDFGKASEGRNAHVMSTKLLAARLPSIMKTVKHCKRRIGMNASEDFIMVLKDFERLGQTAKDYLT